MKSLVKNPKNPKNPKGRIQRLPGGWGGVFPGKTVLPKSIGQCFILQTVQYAQLSFGYVEIACIE